MNQEVIGKGRNHEVFRYSPNKVIKLPIEKGKIPYSIAKESVDFFHYYFAEFIAQTEIEADSHNSYIIKQEYIEGVTLSDCLRRYGLNPIIRKQIQLFSERAWNVYKQEGVTFDILGGKNIPIKDENPWNQCENVIITPDSEIKFIHTVDLSDSIRQSKFINILTQYIPRRKEYVKLTNNLYSQSLTL